MKTTKKDWIYRVILLILLAIIWDIGAALTSPIFVPQKGAVFREFFLLIQNGTMLKAFRYSLVRITVAAALSAGISIPLGCLMKICHPLQKLLYPAIRAMRFLPVTAFYPLLTMWFGIGEKMKIAFLFVASFVFMLPSVLIALDDVSDDVIEAASINDATESSNALISGDLQAAGYTTNRVAFLSQKFTDAGKNIIMPVFTNYSYGGDGIIASTQFADVNSWVNAKIGVPEFSEAETLVAWFVNNSNLSDADKATIMNNLIMFGTADDTAKAYFAGQIDVAATWEPYLTQAKTYTNSTVVFDTKSSSSLVMDGIVFDADWAAAHEDTVKKFVKGILMSYDQPINYDAAREVFPMYSTSSDADIDATYANAKMASWKDNYNILNDTAPMIYNQMCDIWEALGETVNRGLVDTIFDTTYIDALKGDFKSTSAANATTKVTVSDETRANITQQVTGNLDYDSMLSKTANVTFVPDSSVFTDQASAASVLDDFVNIAKTLDGTMIVINGNINADTQTEFGVQLSANRAQTVANYLASQGIDQNRLIITGSGNAKYQADKAVGALKSDASVYQSTDISFMRIEN